MSLAARIYARVSPYLAHRFGSGAATRLHARLILRTGGHVGTRFVGGGRLLVLRTTGRRTGQTRDSPMLYVPYGDAVAVHAANGASARPPAWWLNLQAHPEAEAFIGGSWRAVRARQADGSEAETLRALVERTYEGARHYRVIATRELPIVVLEPR